MPDDTNNQTEVSTNTGGPVITIEKKTTDVLDSNGRELNSGDSPLSKIFDKVASGDRVEEAVTEVMKKPAAAPRKAPVEPKTEDTTKATEEPEKKADVVVEKKEVKDTTPAKETVAPTDEEKVPDEELQVLPHDKPKTAARIKTLLNRLSDVQRMADDTKKEADTKAKRAQELEDELNKVKSQDPLTNEKVKASIDELAMYRRRYELEHMPEVKDRFDGRIVNAENTIAQSLKTNGLSDDLLETIKKEGGWLKFADSQRQIPLANGKTITAAELAETIRAALPVSERRRLDALELEQVQTARDKETYFTQETKRANEYFAEREKQVQAQREAAQRQFEDATKVVVNWKKKFTEDNEWLREKSVTDGLTPEQKAALEDHNKTAKQLNQLIDKHLAAKDINEMLTVLVDAIQYHNERHKLAAQIAENQRLKDQLKASEEKLEKFKKAGGSTPRGGSLAAGIHQPDAPAKKVQTLEEAFDMMAAAKTGE